MASTHCSRRSICSYSKAGSAQEVEDQETLADAFGVRRPLSELCTNVINSVRTAKAVHVGCHWRCARSLGGSHELRRGEVSSCEPCLSRAVLSRNATVGARLGSGSVRDIYCSVLPAAAAAASP